jgi:hypothetical protein
MNRFLKAAVPALAFVASVSGRAAEGPGATGGELPPYVEPFRLLCAVEHYEHDAKIGWVQKTLTETFTKEHVSLKTGNIGIYVEGIPNRLGKQRYKVQLTLKRLRDASNKIELLSEAGGRSGGDQNEVLVEAYLQGMDENRQPITLQRATVRCVEKVIE